MAGMFGDMYFQTGEYNSRLFSIYRNRIIQLAVNRFKWINLPKTCNERFLELVLLYEGVATIAYPKKIIKALEGKFYSTKVAYSSPINIYDNPTKWRSYGNQGWNFSCSPENGVLVWDNRTRYPLLNQIDVWARELVDVRRTKQINRMHVKTPFLLKCAKEQEQQALNIYKQIAGGEPAIITTDTVNNVEIDAVQTGVQYLGEELTAEEVNTWAQIYQTLGIENLTYKAERMVEDEVNKRDKPTDIVALDGLNCRREACDYLNDNFSKYLAAPIDCVWAQDNESVNYNTVNNIKEYAELEKDIGSGEGGDNNGNDDK
jgi:hypothetical protein